ncbi:MAG: sigma-E processing peptidase SpoIIGA [Roseburia sp.]|nr:sigma-E processing peptidase SpoIIGA [Roseburia sp.]
MYYEVYADSLFLINVVMNLYLLILVNHSSFHTASGKRLVLGAVAGACFYLLPFWGGGVLWRKQLLGYFAGTLTMLFLAFPIRSARAFFRILEKLFFYALLMGGILLLLIKSFPGMRSCMDSIFGVMGAGAVVFLLLRQSYLRSLKNAADSICRATLIRGGERMTVDALLDSGNSLIEPVSGKPVCIVEASVWGKLWQEHGEGYRAVPYHSVGKKRGILQGYLLQELQLELGGLVKVFRDVYIAVSEEELSGDSRQPVQLIVNPMLFYP